MKISLEPKELKELLSMLTPQITVIENGVTKLAQQSPLAPLPKFGEAVTAEADYFASVAKYSEPSDSDKVAALKEAVANGFEYEKPSLVDKLAEQAAGKPYSEIKLVDKPNGKQHSEIAATIAAANALLPGN